MCTRKYLIVVSLHMMFLFLYFSFLQLSNCVEVGICFKWLIRRRLSCVGDVPIYANIVIHNIFTLRSYDILSIMYVVGTELIEVHLFIICSLIIK